MIREQAFEVGDIVQLKSGGPDMTVQTVPDSFDAVYKCQWFAGKKLEYGHFPYHSLKAVTAEAK